MQRWRDGSHAGLLQGKFAPVQREGAEVEEPVPGRFAPVQRQGPEDEEVIEEIEAAGGAIQGRFNGKSPHVPVVQKAFTARRPLAPLAGVDAHDLRGAPLFRNQGVYHEHIFFEGPPFYG